MRSALSRTYVRTRVRLQVCYSLDQVQNSGLYLHALRCILHTVAKLQGSLQGKEIDLGSVPGIVDSTTKRLMELKENVNSSMHTVQGSFFGVH